MVFLAVFFIVLLVLVFIIGTNNKIIILENYTKEAFSTMDIYLKKRWDLIPNLVEIAKKYMNHEKETLENITKIRRSNYAAMENNEKIELNNKLSFGLSNLIATAENYPDLKANETFGQLMSELTNVENDIANSRKYYNGSVREYNTYISIFPFCIIAAFKKAQPYVLFEILQTEKQNVKVKF